MAATRTRKDPKPYSPKPTDAGQSITWQSLRGDARTGTVWSPGPVASSVWAIADGSTTPVAVKLASTNRVARELDPAGETVRVRRAERVLAAAEAFQCGRAVHIDPACPALTAADIASGSEPVSRSNLAADIVWGRHPWRTQHCSACIAVAAELTVSARLTDLRPGDRVTSGSYGVYPFHVGDVVASEPVEVGRFLYRVEIVDGPAVTAQTSQGPFPVARPNPLLAAA